MSSDLVYTFAVWSVFDARWKALATSDRRELISSLATQFQSFVSWPHTVVEVAGGTDDDVVAACSRLAPPPEFNWEAVYRDVYESIRLAWFAESVHPPGDPNR